MISVYSSIVNYTEGDWEQYLDRIAMIDIFGPLLKEYPDPGDFSCVVKFILYAYSIESEMLVIGADWVKTKRKIFEKVCLRPWGSVYEDIVLLKNPSILETIKKWMDYQDNDLFEQLQILKDLRAEMQLTCLTPIKKSGGEIDYDQKYKNAQYSVELKKTIKDLESELIQNSSILKDSVKEYREVKRGAQTFGWETFMKEKK